MQVAQNGNHHSAMEQIKQKYVYALGHQDTNIPLLSHCEEGVK
jgi:hypothetical protein